MSFTVGASIGSLNLYIGLETYIRTLQPSAAKRLAKKSGAPAARGAGGCEQAV